MIDSGGKRINNLINKKQSPGNYKLDVNVAGVEHNTASFFLKFMFHDHVIRKPVIRKG